MSNTVTKLLDTQRKVVFKLTGIGPEGRILKIDPSTLVGALNATGVLLASDSSARKPAYRLSLKNIWYDVNPGGGTAAGGFVELSTDGDTGNTILCLSNQHHLGLNEGPEPFVIDLSQNANTTGNIFLQTTGLIPNSSYSIVADFRKNPADFSQGQLENPPDFNQGPRSGGGGRGF